MSLDKRRKTIGYTAPDFTVRCPKCSVGKDNFGNSMGAVIAAQRVICQIKPCESVLVATIGRCCNHTYGFFPNKEEMQDCNALSHFKIKPDGQRLGLTQENILACCQQSKGNLFMLAELQSGQVGTTKLAPRKDFVKKYNPDQYIESQDVPF